MRDIRIRLGFIGVFFWSVIQLAAAQAAEVLPGVTAKSAVVIEAQTGRIIYARDAKTRRYPASTTKMMTLIVALEHGRMDEIVTASRQASETEGSSIWLEAGEQQRLENLCYAMMLVSGNDATVAVAEHIAGSVENFARMMTEKAREIGAENTSFVNSSGLPDPRHYSTAYDLAKIAAYGYRNPLFTKIVSTKEVVIPWQGKPYGRDLGNENKLLWRYEGGNGVKTGYTEAAGHCLVSGARRGGIQLIAVVLDSEDMWGDSKTLLNYGFARSMVKPILEKGTPIKTVRVMSGYEKTVDLVVDSDLSVPVVDGSDAEFSTVIDAPEQVQASVQAGQPIGKVRMLYEGKEIAAVDLVAAATVERRSFFAQLYHLFSSGTSYIWNLFRG